MGEQTAIAWTDHTFNPWWGCQRVSPGCEHCYAETFAKRHGVEWGAIADRRFFGDKHWDEPRRWDRAAAKAGVRRRVFCASMSDVFEDRADLSDARERLFGVIEATRHLDWLLLTKRPENMNILAPLHWAGAWPSNVWAGTTAEDNKRLEQRLPHLLRVPAVIRFLSCEPLLEDLDLESALHPALTGRADAGVHWVIGGGESGFSARRCNVSWLRNIVHDCDSLGIVPFIKQLGSNAVDHCDEVTVDGCGPSGCANIDHVVRVKTKHRKGEDPAEWPTYIQRQDFPEVRA